MAAITPTPADQMTTSEIVLLHGERFAKKAVFGNVPLPHCDQEVSAAELGRTILSTAFLACEASGDFRLEVRETKGFLGIRKSRTLFAEPCAGSGAWSEDSVEGSLAALTRRMADKGLHDVRSLVHAWLGQDSGAPWRAVVEKLEEGMARRGLLERQEEKKMVMFTVARYSLPQPTAELRESRPPAEVLEMLDRCRRERPEVFGLLAKHIDKAIRDRTDQD